MLVQELYEERYDDYVYRLINTLKIPLLGDGKFANVFQHPVYKNVAVKIFPWDAGYSKYLAWCRKHQDNPYVPKIIDVVKTKTEDDDLVVVFFEKLQPSSSEFIKKKLKQITRESEIPPADTFIHLTISDWKKISLNSKDAYLRDIAKFFSSRDHLLDLHTGNIMRRGNQLVFIDPFSA